MDFHACWFLYALGRDLGCHFLGVVAFVELAGFYTPLGVISLAVVTGTTQIKGAATIVSIRPQA
ncbi:hypothetical protein [Kutzneria buriramensis]|uniref:hypothetical protein n=1 Tax=Kutzneria buriramensis TaxID=1045776 RepID=UPI0011C153E4|nr:hypothetical protein [Kutzneria buriramensis]